MQCDRLMLIVGLSFLTFFFSSRRRHTRCYRDWSSDVCSSDLTRWPDHPIRLTPPRPPESYRSLPALWRTTVPTSPQPHPGCKSREASSDPPLCRALQQFSLPDTFSRSEERRVGKQIQTSVCEI